MIGPSRPSFPAIQLEFAAEDAQRPDPFAVGAAAQGVTAALRRDGYVLEPVYTGLKGGELFSIVPTLVQSVHDNKDLLLAAVNLATPIVRYLLGRRGEGTPKAAEAAPATRVLIEVEGASVAVEAGDVEHPDQLASRFRAAHPHAADAVAEGGVITIKVLVPAKSPRRRR